ncbi:hypothetical protein D0Z00_000257 [Geotrichum galactomycetum]|uniref:Uncharacterized protein n=1 Tax=Geotrichum galactomycetum TaxID=27317 RepID=A0ACB6VAV4_9ASCO|nr:hypothetical protein D0Z00_000257 [Geotrichum candidum]
MSTSLDLPPSYDSSLPSYSLNVDVQPTEPGIHYESLRVTVFDQQPVYDLGDIIQGIVSIAPTCPMQLDTLLVLLECIETTQILRWASDNDKRRCIAINFHRVELPYDRTILPGFLYTFPFSIQVPEAKLSTSCSRGFTDHKRLSPSLSALDGSPAKGPVSIQYRLHAALGTGTVDHMHAYAPLFVLPSYSVSPNAERRVNVTNTHTAVQKLRSRMGLRRSVATKPYAQIRLDKLPPLPVSTTTIVPIILTAFGGNNVPPTITTVSAKLVSYTIYSGQAQFATSPPVLYAPGILDFSTMMLLGSYTMANPVWKREEDITTGQLSNATVLNLPVALPALIPPTFESCYISRVYSLLVSLTIEGERHPLELEVPVNLVSPNPPRNMAMSTVPEKGSSSRDDFLDIEGDEHGLPSYSR